MKKQQKDMFHVQVRSLISFLCMRDEKTERRHEHQENLLLSTSSFLLLTRTYATRTYVNTDDKNTQNMKKRLLRLQSAFSTS